MPLTLKFSFCFDADKKKIYSTVLLCFAFEKGWRMDVFFSKDSCPLNRNDIQLITKLSVKTVIGQK